MWSVVEINCAVLCACIPTLRPLVRSWATLKSRIDTRLSQSATKVAATSDTCTAGEGARGGSVGGGPGGPAGGSKSGSVPRDSAVGPDIEGGIANGSVSDERKMEEGKITEKVSESGSSQEGVSSTRSAKVVNANSIDDGDDDDDDDSDEADDGADRIISDREKASATWTLLAERNRDHEIERGGPNFHVQPPSPTTARTPGRDSVARTSSVARHSAIEWNDDFFDDVPEALPAQPDDMVTPLSPPPPRRNTGHTMGSLPERKEAGHLYLESPTLG